MPWWAISTASRCAAGRRPEAQLKVKEAIAQAGPGGGFVLSDNHGEIPWQVPEDVLLGISAAVEEWGRYPLNWVGEI